MREHQAGAPHSDVSAAHVTQSKLMSLQIYRSRSGKSKVEHRTASHRGTKSYFLPCERIVKYTSGVNEVVDKGQELEAKFPSCPRTLKTFGDQVVVEATSVDVFELLGNGNEEGLCEYKFLDPDKWLA
jgi:hypothetical protein